MDKKDACESKKGSLVFTQACRYVKSGIELYRQKHKYKHKRLHTCKMSIITRMSYCHGFVRQL